MRGAFCRAAWTAAAVSVLLAALPSAPRAQEAPVAASDSVATSTLTSGAPADSSALPPRKLLSTDGAVNVFEERRTGEGINGFWWEYDAPADLVRLLDEDRRSRALDKLLDAFGFEISAPESIVVLRDSVTAVADSILATRIGLATRFDPKLSTRYTENRDTFDFVNEVVSPIPLSRRATFQTTVTNNDSFNESTGKVRAARTVGSTCNYIFRPQITSSLQFSRNNDQQRRDETVESNTTATSVTGRMQAVQRVGPLGEMTADLGLANSRNHYETQVTDGSSDLISPTWSARFKRPAGASQLSLDYSGGIERGTREELQTVTVLDAQGLPILDPSGQPQAEQRRAETKDSNGRNRLDVGADGKLTATSTYRLSSSLSRDRTQYIAQTDSVTGLQETRTNTVQSLTAHVDSKPFEGLSVRVDGDLSRNEFNYDLEAAKFNETSSWGGEAEVLWDSWEESKITIRLGRDREDRNYRTSQAGVVDKESAGLNWKQTVTPKVEFSANYDVSLDSFLFDDKVANTGDRDLSNQRGVFTVRYNVTSAFTSSVRMDVRETQTINISPQKTRDNRTDYAYVITPNYTWKIGPASITGEFAADARYGLYDFADDLNALTRRFSTRQRWQQALTARVSAEVLGTYEIVDDGSYNRSSGGGPRLYNKARETRRFRVESTLLYNPKAWLRTRVTYRQDGDDSFSFSGGTRAPSGVFRTEEFTYGITIKKKFMRGIDLDLDFNNSQKDGDRVTDVERRYYTIRASLEYRPFGEKGNG